MIPVDFLAQSIAADPSTPTKIIEVSVGLGAAALIIDRILSWTLKWKKSANGNGYEKSERARLAAVFERPEFIKHDVKMDALVVAMTSLCNANARKDEVTNLILASSERQEETLQKLADAIPKQLRGGEKY